MDERHDYPGTPRHQQLLRTVVHHYEGDPRIVAVIVFGSLGRGNWDRHSDLDLDFIVTDDARIDVITEMQAMCAEFAVVGEPAAVLIPDGSEEAHVVLLSRIGLSVRFHPLKSTSPSIVESMRILAGAIDVPTVTAAALARPAAVLPPLTQLLDECLRYATEMSAALDRERPWMALELLHRQRGLLMQIFARTHGSERAVHAFDALASHGLQQHLAATVRAPRTDDLREALLTVLDIIENDMLALSARQLSPTALQRALLDAVRRDVRDV